MKKYIFILTVSVLILSCTNPFTKKADEDMKRWEEAYGCSWHFTVDNDIHRFNITHDTLVLYNTLTYLNDINPNETSERVWFSSKLIVLRLLHKYDVVFAMLDTCSNDVVGDYGRLWDYMVTEISMYNYYQQYENLNQKLEELIVYMEYCIERQKFVSKRLEYDYLKKYKDNQLALDAVATKADCPTLSWYVGARLMRGDKKDDVKSQIEDFYKQGVINAFDRDCLIEKLPENNKEVKIKDFDSWI